MVAEREQRSQRGSSIAETLGRTCPWGSGPVVLVRLTTGGDSMAWSNTHDIAYSFLCVSFLADHSMSAQELDAISGNVKVLLPELPPGAFEAAMNESVDKFFERKGEDAKIELFEECLSRLGSELSSDDERFTFIKNLAYIARADKLILDKELELVERAVAALGMTDKLTLQRQEQTLLVNKKS